MKISNRQLEKATILDVEGKIDLQTSPAFRKALMESLNHVPLVIVNFLSVSYVDSSGIASMVECFQASKRLQKRILYFGLNPMVLNVLELTHLTRVFEIHETEEESLQAASL